MTRPVPTRFTEEELAILDRLVAQGVGASRSEVIRRAVAQLDEAVRRAHVGRVIADSYRAQPQTADDDALAMASAVAMTEAEPW